MKGILYSIVAALILIAGCGPITVKKPDKQVVAEESVQQIKTDSVVVPIPDSSLLAYGNLFFGMKKAAVESKNEQRQKLGKFNYNFDYNFNGDSALFRVIIKSDGAQVVSFDTELIANYKNLAKIVETRYEKPASHNRFPSVFDVQNSGRFIVDRWNMGNKQIDILIKENSINSYSVVCEITHQPMAEAELLRLKNIKNKDVNEAAKKF